ncbi:hypothetical protein ABK040_009895 [Willaertia magna]
MLKSLQNLLFVIFKWIFRNEEIKIHYHILPFGNQTTSILNNKILKIVHLTDIHFDYYQEQLDNLTWREKLINKIKYHRITKSQLSKMIENINELNVDIIVITGDLFQQYLHIDVDWLTQNFLNKLKSKYGIYCILGNHDERHCDLQQRNILIQKLNESIITILDPTTSINQHNFFTKIKIDNNNNPFEVEIVGFPDFYDNFFWEYYHKIVKFINEQPINENTFRILLSHNPDTIRWLKQDILHLDLILAGHTHHGQVKIPLPSILLRNLSLSFISTEQEKEMKQNYFVYIPLIPIIGYIFKKLPIWSVLRKRIEKFKIVQRVLNVCKNWEWGSGLCELNNDIDSSTLIDRFSHLHQQHQQQSEIKMIYRKSKFNRGRFCYTSSGVGTHFPFRLFCAPEIAHLTVTFN